MRKLSYAVQTGLIVKLPFAALIGVALVLVTPAAAQYSIDWYSIAGGAEAAAGDGYSLGGTIGQFEAGTASGGDYTLIGGFWSVSAQPPPCVGDVNGDRQVSLPDLSLLLASYGFCAGDTNYLAAADFDGNNCIDLADLSQLLARFGAICP